MSGISLCILNRTPGKLWEAMREVTFSFSVGKIKRDKIGNIKLMGCYYSFALAGLKFYRGGELEKEKIKLRSLHTQPVFFFLPKVDTH